MWSQKLNLVVFDLANYEVTQQSFGGFWNCARSKTILRGWKQERAELSASLKNQLAHTSGGIYKQSTIDLLRVAEICVPRAI